ncbi:uncharacterized protein LOC107360759 [Tetranychus urticae]|nr:uncharacterized protein LOC107360759 [Tetranychus urticae]
MGLFDLQLYPCVNGQCLQYRNKLDLTSYLTTIGTTSTPISDATTSAQSVNSKMIDWQGKGLMPVNSLTNSSFDTNGTLYSSIINGSSPVTLVTTTKSSSWIPIQALGLNLRSESWVIPLLTLSSINILFILLLESLVIFRVHRKTSKPPQLFLGQTLLLALLLTSLHGFATLLSPNHLTCTLNQAGLGLGYSLIFGTLLVKSIFLLSLHSGTYLPLLYQFLLLFFIMSTQIILSIQGIFTSPAFWDHFNFWPTFSSPSSSSSLLSTSSTSLPSNNVTSSTDPSSSLYHYSTKQPTLCSDLSTNDTYYYSLGYNILLLTIVSIISFRIRRHRENYREALFIAISGFASILIWITWITGSLVSHDSGHDAFTGFGLQVNSLIIFLVMFTPKAKQLIKLSWVKGDASGGTGVDLDDDEDDGIVNEYCDDEDDGCDTMRRELRDAVGGRRFGGREGGRRRQRQRPSLGNRIGTINRNGCSVEYSGHDSNQSLCAQSFVHLNPNYLSHAHLLSRPFYHPLHHPNHQYPLHQPNRKQNQAKAKQSHQIYSSSNNLVHSHGHFYSQPPPPQQPSQPMDSIRSSQENWNHQKNLLNGSKSSTNHRSDRFIYTNTLLKSLTDESFSFYRIPNIPPIKPIYLNSNR